MELFDYLMAKKGHNTGGDLFSYLLGKNAGGSGTYTTFSGITLNIASTLRAKIKNFMLNSTELTQDGTPTPENPVDVNVITGDNNVKINQNLAQMYKNNIIDGYALTADGLITEAGDYVIYIPCESNTQYEIYKVQSERLRIATTIENPATIPQIYQFYNSSDTIYASITTNNEAKYLCIFFRRFSDTLTMQEILDTMNVYETRQEQNYPITLSSKNLALNDDTNNPDVNYENSGAGSVAIQYDTTEQGFYTTTSRARFFKLEEGKTYVFSVYGKYRTTGNAHYIYYYYFNSTTEEATAVQGSISISQSDNYNRYSKTFTIPSGYDGFKIIVFNGLYFKDIQLEEGSTATEYEPYYNIEYCKIGDYADQIFKNTTDSEFYDSTLLENEWYLKKNIGKIDSYNGETITTSYISTTGGLDTGATVYYVLATPTYTHISQTDYPTLKSELDNLYNNAKSYNGQTNITQTNDDLPFNISVDVKIKTE